MTNCLQLKKSNCKNCYKCIRNCPVKSIKFSDNQAHIVKEECILCGRCFVACPQNAKEIRNDVDKVKTLISSGKTVIASVAPSFVANYSGISMEGMKKALKKLGFSRAEETAIGATIVKKRYEQLIEKGEDNIIISSCCHSVNMLIEKYYPEFIPYLAKVLSPMQAHGVKIREDNPEASVVFIGPCISKKDEAEKSKGIIDYVLTFEELEGWLREEKIEIEIEDVISEEGRARSFPTSGGIIASMDLNENFNYVSIDGMDNCINAMEDISKGKINNCFIEMSACTGSCIGGPVMNREFHNPVSDFIAVKKYAGKKDFNVVLENEALLEKSFNFDRVSKAMPGSKAIEEILRKMGKVSKEKELNCGSCGYNTCRDKAVAVFMGKADLTMCLPYLKEKAESFSDIIINNTPNGIIVMNEDLEIQQINPQALKILGIRNKKDIIHGPIIRILDPTDYVLIQTEDKAVYEKLKYLAEYKKYVEETVVYDKEYHLIMSIIKDVTEEQEIRQLKENQNKQTIEITDKVIEKQMRVVQEIASLLGETTAETKIALTKLKETLSNE